MYTELFRIPAEINGVPLFGWGVLLVLWTVGGAAVFLVHGYRFGAKSVLGYLPGWLIGAAILLFLPRMFPDGLPIRGYGVMVLSGAIVGIAMAVHRARQVGLNPELLFSLALAMFVCGIVGARLFYVIEYWNTRFQYDDWISTLMAIAQFTEGGLVIYGAFLGGVVAFLVVAWRNHLPTLALADLIAPSLLAGLALGRIGCLLNGCCYGGETSLPWAITFPRDSPPYLDQLANGRPAGFRLQADPRTGRPAIGWVDEGSLADAAGIGPGMGISAINGQPVESVPEAQDTLYHAIPTGKLSLQFHTGENLVVPVSLPERSSPVHPTQLYSAINAALLGWVLWAYYPLARRDGEVAALLITLYPASRFLIERIRIDESPVFGTGLSISQNISIALLVCAALLWTYLRSRSPRREFFPKSASRPAAKS